MDEVAILGSFGDRILAPHRLIELAQEQFALVAEVDRSYFGAVERGERKVTFTSCVDWPSLCGVT